MRLFRRSIGRHQLIYSPIMTRAGYTAHIHESTQIHGTERICWCGVTWQVSS